MSPLNQSLLTLVELLLIVTLPIIALAAFQHVRLNAARLKSETSEGERKTIAEIIRIAVAAAEQTGIVEKLIGAEKKEYALEVAETFLRDRGINLDLKRLSNLIEAEVLKQARGEGAPSVDTAANRQALFNNAVQVAVLAAEQSGLKGLIQNIGTEKKDYAVRLTTQFLEADGLKADPEVVSGLIEAQLMKLRLAARGQLPTGDSQ